MFKFKILLYSIPLILTACGGAKVKEVQVLDHFKCYVVEGEIPPQQALMLKDQFQVDKNVRLTELRYFCNPVTKTVGEDEKPHQAAPDEDHLTCYAIEPEQPFTAMVSTRNQFGKNNIKSKKSELLCVPTHKYGFEKLADQTEHCPGGENCCCNMADGIGGTWPDCDAGMECRRQANPTNPNDAIQVCVPVGTPAGAPLQLHSSQPPFCSKTGSP